MIDAFATPERQALRATVRRFVTRDVLPHQDGWERAGELPRSLHKRAAELDLIGLPYPEEVGGGGGDAIDSVVLAEEMHYAGGAGGVFAGLFTSGVALPHLVAAGDAAQIDRWVRPTIDGDLIGSLAVTEPDAGSDVAGIRTTAERHGAGYVVNGAKTYITSGVRADFVVTAVRTGDAGARGISLLVIEKGTPGFGVSARLEKMGWLCSDTAELSFADVHVPAANLIGAENTGFVQIAQNFVSERIALAVQAYASAQRSLDLAVQWCRLRETFGRALISRQTVQHTLAEMARKVEVARVYTRQVACRAAAGEDNLVKEACFAKEHRRRGRQVGRGPGRPAAWRHGLPACGGSGAAVPRHARPGHRRRHRRDPDRAVRQAPRLHVMTRSHPHRGSHGVGVRREGVSGR